MEHTEPSEVKKKRTLENLCKADSPCGAGGDGLVVVVMSAVQGVTQNGTTITIEPPGGGWTAIIPICPFVIEDGETTVVGLQLSVRRSFRWRYNRFHFQPHFECEQDEQPED